jgi:hypothetical protein
VAYPRETVIAEKFQAMVALGFDLLAEHRGVALTVLAGPAALAPALAGLRIDALQAEKRAVFLAEDVDGNALVAPGRTSEGRPTCMPRASRPVEGSWWPVGGKKSLVLRGCPG